MGSFFKNIIKAAGESGDLGNVINVATRGGSLGDIINEAAQGGTLGTIVDAMTRRKKKAADDEEIEDEELVDGDEDAETAEAARGSVRQSGSRRTQGRYGGKVVERRNTIKHTDGKMPPADHADGIMFSASKPVSRVLYLTVIYLDGSLPIRSSHPGSGRASLGGDPLLPYRCCSG